jgi:hypothetical protein
LFNPVVPTISPEQTAANGICRRGVMQFKRLTQYYLHEYAQVWSNPAATPDKIIAAMGTNAQQIFAASAGLGAYLASLGASVPTASPKDAAGNFLWNFQMNADGSITLTKAAT